MSGGIEKTERDEQIKLLWRGNKLDDARKNLQAHYTAQLNAQSTRLIGFTVGLFVLITLAQTSKEGLHNIFSHLSPIIIFANGLGLWDGLKIGFLFLGTTLILAFILRAIFRYSIFGGLSSRIMSVPIDSARTVVSEFIEEGPETNPLKFEDRACWALEIAAVREMYNAKIPLFLIFQPNLFHSYEYTPKDKTKHKAYESREKLGYIYLILLAAGISALLMLFLW